MFLLAWAALNSLLSLPSGQAGSPPVLTLQNRFVKIGVGANGTVLEFSSRAPAHNWATGAPLAVAHKGVQAIACTAAARHGDALELGFGDSGIHAEIRLSAKSDYLKVDVVSAAGDGLDRLDFVDIPMTFKGISGEPFAACALALNLKTNVEELPKPASRLRAICTKRFGFVGASMAIVAAPPASLRIAMQAAVKDAPGLPHSPIGGPWVLGSKISKGSYLFNFGDMTEQKADRWIALAKRLGVTQIDFHGGTSFRFGDCFPNPKTYPNGRASFKAVIDKLHAAGIKAGLHTYAFFIDKKCPWVTPVPDKKLAKDTTFTLAHDLSASDTFVPVLETTEKMNTTTGFFVWNSITLQVDDELITYSGVQKAGQFAFTGCTRGALGTHAAAHSAGAHVGHLKECFGLFVPDPETTLFAQVAQNTADMFNQCGFDMIYLDALDGEGILGGSENAWHYGSQFVFDIFSRVKKAPLMEMSTFHHHLWYVRSRMGAWDHPTRSHKEFIDIHCEANLENERMYLPGELGWWSVRAFTGAQGEPTYIDDMEYLMCKCIGTGNGMALMGIDPDTIEKPSALPRVADLVRRYEEIRLSGKVPEATRKQLAQPGAEFTLTGDLKSGWKFVPVTFNRHKVEDAAGDAKPWSATNLYAAQSPSVRIEALLSADSKPETRQTLADPAAGELKLARQADGVVASLTASVATPDGALGATLVARNNHTPQRGAWAEFRKEFATPQDIRSKQALGLWVNGDSSGALLNVQLLCPSNIVAGIGEHYITLDFTGWRFIELIEPEGNRWAQYSWPYGDPYSIYRETTDYSHISSVGIWVNNLAPEQEVHIGIGPILALPIAEPSLKNPSLSVGANTVTFPGEIPSGGYLEWPGSGTAHIYGRQGELIADVQPVGSITMAPGSNTIMMKSEGMSAGPRSRAKVSLRMGQTSK